MNDMRRGHSAKTWRLSLCVGGSVLRRAKACTPVHGRAREWPYWSRAGPGRPPRWLRCSGRRCHGVIGEGCHRAEASTQQAHHWGPRLGWLEKALRQHVVFFSRFIKKKRSYFFFTISGNTAHLCWRAKYTWGLRTHTHTHAHARTPLIPRSEVIYK